MAWAKNGTPTTLGSAGDDLDITDLTAKKFNQFLFHGLVTGAGSGRGNETFNNNTNSVYAQRSSNNGAADATYTSQATWFHDNQNDDEFKIIYLCSISGEEKLGIYFHVYYGAAGAGTAPIREGFVGKFVPSPDADITRIDINNDVASFDFDTSSNLSALGTD